MSRLRDLDDDMLECRAFRQHSMERIPNDPTEVPSRQVFRESGGTQRITRRCVRCGTIRIVVWGRVTGRLIYSTYKYPDGYTLTDPDDRPPVRARKTFIRRLNAGRR
jgi:hypothetical protein